jgi:uncharacterized protein with von Willebrand factor type A (vWA) domain
VADRAEFGVETIGLDLPALTGAFGRRLHDAGIPCTPERSERFARGLSLVRPVSRRQLYWTARAVFVSDPGQVGAFDRVFAATFGSGGYERSELTDEDDVRTVPAPPDERPSSERS